MAHRQIHEVRHVRVHCKRNDNDDTHRCVQRGGLDDRDHSIFVGGEVFSTRYSPHFPLERKEAVDNEKRVGEGESDLKAEIPELIVDAVDAMAGLREDESRQPCDVWCCTGEKEKGKETGTYRPWLQRWCT